MIIQYNKINFDIFYNIKIQNLDEIFNNYIIWMKCSMDITITSAVKVLFHYALECPVRAMLFF
jgi:hypothetical protein